MAGYDLQKEKNEAIDAGRRALKSLKAAYADLNSARNWGIFDMVGGGMISTLAKRSKMKNAQANMDRARYDLRSFSRELNDVSMVCDLHIETDDFLSFADWFFDDFFIDWMVQDRIKRAQKQVGQAIDMVQNILKRLENYGSI